MVRSNGKKHIPVRVGQKRDSCLKITKRRLAAFSQVQIYKKSMVKKGQTDSHYSATQTEPLNLFNSSSKVGNVVCKNTFSNPSLIYRVIIRSEKRYVKLETGFVRYLKHYFKILKDHGHIIPKLIAKFFSLCLEEANMPLTPRF